MGPEVDDVTAQSWWVAIVPVIRVGMMAVQVYSKVVTKFMVMWARIRWRVDASRCRLEDEWLVLRGLMKDG